MAPSINIVIFFTITLYLFFILSPTNARRPNAKLSKIGASVPVPYETVNNFCLYRRLDVGRPFCLSVLKKNHAAHAKGDDVFPLLEVAINSTSIFTCKTLSFLQDLHETMKSRAVEDCLSAYEDIAEYMTKVITDISSEEAMVTSVDGEVIVNYINICEKAATKIKSSELTDKNEEAKRHAMLMVDIADVISNNKPL